MGSILVGVVAWVAAEIVAALLVAEAAGGAVTMLMLLAAGVVGVVLVKREGARAIRQAGTSGARALDGSLIVVAGVLFLVPGFLSDLGALGLLFPPVRRVVGAEAAARVQRSIERRFRVVNLGFGGVGGFTRPQSEHSPDASGHRRTNDEVIDVEAEVVYLDENSGELER